MTRTKLSDFGPPLVSVLSVGLFGGLIATMMFHTVPAENKTEIVTALALLGAWAAQSVHYWLGNSSTGDDANDVIAATVRPAAPAPTAPVQLPSGQTVTAPLAAVAPVEGNK